MLEAITWDAPFRITSQVAGVRWQSKAYPDPPVCDMLAQVKLDMTVCTIGRLSCAVVVVVILVEMSII